jgi:hypothetical protein
MPDVGYYSLPVILSFQGVDKQVNTTLGRTLGTAGVKGGKEFGQGIAAGVTASEADVKRGLDKHVKLTDKVADATGRVCAEQAKLNDLQAKSIGGGRYATSVFQPLGVVQSDLTT